MTTRGSKLLDELNSASQSVSGTTERGRGWKKERGSERGTVQNFRQSRFEHNFSYGKVSSSVCPPTLERGKERQVAGFSRFPSAFSNFCRPRGESWKRWDKQNRYRTEGTHRGSKRRHRIEPFLCSPPPAPTNFRIVFVENFRRAKHTSKISLPRRKRDIYAPMKTEKERKKNITRRSHRRDIERRQEEKDNEPTVGAKLCERNEEEKEERIKGKGGRQARQRKESRKEEYYTRSKFISGHPGGRNRRGQIPSRASPSSFAKPVRNLHPRRRPSLPASLAGLAVSTLRLAG